MDSQQFEKILMRRIRLTQEVLRSKAVEYAHGDRLYNFKRAGDILSIPPEKALLGMMAKHVVSVIDLVAGKLPRDRKTIDEKIGDTINYLILLEASLLEHGEEFTYDPE